MKATFAIVAIIIAASTNAFAQTEPLFMDRDTIENSRMRHSAERYQIYQQNNYQAPLGGYPDTFGNSAPYGTAKPGYAGQQNNYAPPLSQQRELNSGYGY